MHESPIWRRTQLHLIVYGARALLGPNDAGPHANAGAVRLWRLGDTPPPLLPDARHSRLGDTAGALHDTWSREAAGERGERRVQLAGTLSGHTGDVYSVRFHPSAPLLVTAGYDRTVRPLDHDTPSRASRPRHPSPPTTPRSPDLAGAPL